MSQYIQSVKNAMKLLALFTVESPYLTVTEIALKTGLSKGGVSKIMATLASDGFVTKEAKGYSLGYTMVHLAGVALTKNKIRESISPILNQVTTDLKEDSHVSVLEGFNIIYLQKTYSYKHSAAKTVLGGRNPAHCTSSGKILLAYKSEYFIKNFIAQGLKSYTEHTISNPIKLQKELQFIRNNGYAISMNELTNGISSLAVPIKDYTKQVVASLSIVGSSKLLTYDKITSYISYLKQAGMNASKEIGYYSN